MPTDKVGATGELAVGVERGDRAPALNPCPVCQRETVDHRKDGAPKSEKWRICMNDVCRYEFQVNIVVN